MWDYCKAKVTDKESALRLSRIMRDNRNVAMMLLYDFMDKGEYLFLLTLLNLNYADYEYEILPNSIDITNQIITVKFMQKVSSLKYVEIQKIRKIRVAFSALDEYAKKENRNGYMVTSPEIDSLKNTALKLLSSTSVRLKAYNRELRLLLTNDATESAIGDFLRKIDYQVLVNTSEYVQARAILCSIMNLVGLQLSNNWNNARYAREIED